MSDPRDLLVGLLDYIKEQAKEIDASAYRLSSSKGFMKQRPGVAGLPGVEFDIRLLGDHIWLRVPRLTAEPAPDVQKAYKGVIKSSNDPHGNGPSLDDAAFSRLMVKATEGARLRGASERQLAETDGQQREAVRQAFLAYQATWAAWAAGERPRRQTIALYGDLFALKHQIEAEQTGKPQELVWGIGVSTWQLKQDKKAVSFEYPLLTQVMEIAIDSKSLALDLRPRATQTQVEMDAFIACQIASAIEVEKAVESQLEQQKDTPVTPFDVGSFTPALKLMAGNLDSEGAYIEVLTKELSVPPPGEHLVITDAWVIFSRPKTVNFLFEDLRRLQEKLLNGCDLHDGPLALVTPPSDEPIDFLTVNFRGLSSRGSSDNGQAVRELYFPLPYNDEQVTIVQRLEHAPGVTVQGPPGTGKTHTIANIICHYLATGKRVLVTSRGEQALHVLQEKIPEDVRSLTVALLTSDREGIRQFQGSIEAIQHRVTQTNPELLRQEIQRLEGSIQRGHSELLSIDRKVDDIALQQLADVEIDGQKLRAQDLAELVVAGEGRYQWFNDLLTLAPEHAPPLESNEAGRLREARRKLGSDLVYVSAKLPSAESFPPISDIGDLHDVLVKREGHEDQVRQGSLLAVQDTSPEGITAMRQLHDLACEILECISELEQVGEPWPLILRAKCGQPSYALERAALEALFDELDSLKQARAVFLRDPISFPESGLDDARTKEAVARAADTGKPFGIVALGAGHARGLLAAVKVAGRVPGTKEEWIKVNDWLRLHERILVFNTRWNEIHELLGVPALDGGVTSLRTLEMTGSVARRAHQLATVLDGKFQQHVRAVFETGIQRTLDTSPACLERIQQALDKHLNNASLTQAALRLSDVQAKLAGKSGPIIDKFRAFTAETLGNKAIPRERVSADYAEILAELRRLALISSDLCFVEDMAAKIEGTGAPRFAQKIRATQVSAAGEDAGFPTAWREAWNWARMRTHLDSIESRNELIALSSKRREIESGLARFYQEMVAKSAWLSTKRNATPRILQALNGYATAVRRIGQGTGPNAIRYRRDARDAMYEAAGAVPCWIMNHSRISESMPADIGAFDLVIVDEASQSDLWALPAILRGKKILVVGDDKQVSPDGGFVDSTRIEELRSRFLSKQYFAAEMTPEKSLYDLAARVFAANQVMLREHFRCVPPIIAYSNRVFYKNQILPLRIPRASERIDPPLVDLFVERGIP